MDLIAYGQIYQQLAIRGSAAFRAASLAEAAVCRQSSLKATISVRRTG